MCAETVTLDQLSFPREKHLCSEASPAGMLAYFEAAVVFISPVSQSVSQSINQS